MLCSIFQATKCYHDIFMDTTSLFLLVRLRPAEMSLLLEYPKEKGSDRSLFRQSLARVLTEADSDGTATDYW